MAKATKKAPATKETDKSGHDIFNRIVELKDSSIIISGIETKYKKANDAEIAYKHAIEKTVW